MFVDIGDAMRDYAGTIPVLLDLDLYRAGWDGSTELYPGVAPRTVAMQSLRKSILKKFSCGTNNRADSKALELFLKINSKCSEWQLDSSSMTEVETIALGEAKSFIYDFFYPNDAKGEILLSYSKIAEGFSLGNGANIGARSTDFLSKVGTSTMAATSSLVHDLYVHAISSNRTWSNVESIRSRNRGCEIVKGSRLSFVPKTAEISRTIATEPVCNMLLQKGIGRVLERRLKQVIGIDLTSQPDKNRVLARIGSYGNNRFGTIDLSSASDSLSLGLANFMFPSQVMYWLETCRSPVTVLPDGSIVELHMVSSMGNAFTFPLQTLLFASLVYGVYRVMDISLSRPSIHSLGNFAVFGDDIIVMEKAYNLTVRMLSLCGFSVNVDKSFNDGLFRESCGHDYFCGVNVRGVYIKQLVDMHDMYSAVNRLNNWSAQHGIVLHETVSFLLKGCRLLPIPFDEMDIHGVKLPSCAIKKPKFNRNGSFIYRIYRQKVFEIDVTDVECRPPSIRGWVNNPEAVLLAALAGTLRNGKVVPRMSRRSSQTCVRSSPRWDWFGPGQRNADFGKRWKAFVMLNLNIS